MEQRKTLNHRGIRTHENQNGALITELHSNDMENVTHLSHLITPSKFT